MKYRKIIITTNAAGIEVVSAALIGEGITDIEIDNPMETVNMIGQLNSSEWYDASQIPEVEDYPPRVIIYGEMEEPSGANLMEKVERAVTSIKDALSQGAFGEAADLGTLQVEEEILEDDWRDKWKDYFRPSRISDRIIVKPTWYSLEDAREGELASCSPEDIVIEIDPGMAFGTGTHETTSLALKMLEKYLVPGNKVLDVGVGSGILSIAAAKLGASEVLGIDIDEDAVRVAIENEELNGVSHITGAVKGDLTQGVDFKADLVVANLLADLVMRLSGDVKTHLREGGIFISSGILVEKRAEVEEAIKNAGMEIQEVSIDGDWCSIVAR